MAKQSLAFLCAHCNVRFPKWMGRCPECGEWNSVHEDLAPYGKGVVPLRGDHGPAAPPMTVALTEAGKEAPLARFPAGFGEVDRVLGGGVLAGSVILLGGDPGIGKSTLALQVAAALATSPGDGGHPALYVSGEESAAQIRARADRLGLRGDGVRLLAAVELETVLAEVDRLSPRLVVVDSIQTLRSLELEAGAGSVSQVRHCTGRLMEQAKATGAAFVLVGHVTKDGAIAGPRTLEHMVDVVLYLEGSDDRPRRILRSVKNRFGSVNEIGLFTMTGQGLAALEDPGAHFLAERSGGVPGTAIYMGMEGTRPLPIEIQALVGERSTPSPHRTALGLDAPRVAMLQAVMEKHLGAVLSGLDIHLNVVSGLRLTEPALDTAVVAALLSSFRNRPLDPSVVVFGEIGLTGELRGVPFGPERLQEAARLGFQRAVVPAPGRGATLRKIPSLRIEPVATVEALAEILFP